MKKAVWALLSIVALTLVGCTQVATFNVSDFTPQNAQDIKVQDVDFDGDGSPEKVVYYKSDDTVGFESKRTNEHLVILAYKDAKWQIVKEDAFVNSNVAGLRFLIDQKVIDFGSDKKQELFVQWAPERPLGIGTYYVVAFVNGEYKFLNSPTLNELEYLDTAKGEKEIYLTAVAPSSNRIKESYTIFCENDLKGKPMSDRYGKSCRQLDLTVTFYNGILKRQ
jgi:hypothetical protein